MKKIALNLMLLLGFAQGVIAEENVFRYALKGDIHNTDPMSLYDGITFSTMENVYEGLVRRDNELKTIPGLAVKWENREPTVWRFYLRQGVKFHGGEDFTAKDVVFSHQRAASEHSDMKAAMASIKEVKIIDDFTVDVITHHPNPILIDDIYSMLIMSKEWCEKHGAQKPAAVGTDEKNYAMDHMNGTGAFMLESRQPDVKTVFVRNPNWWSPRVHNLDRVEFQAIASDATRVAALLAGQLDMISPVPLQDVKRVENDDRFELMKKEGLWSIYLALDSHADKLRGGNLNTNPLKDKRVRKAFYHAINTDMLVKKIMRSNAVQTNLLIASAIKGFNESANKRGAFDPELSKKLMKEAGFENGFSLAMECPNDRYANDQMICEAVVAMLAKIGVKVALNAQTKSKFFDTVLKDGADMNIFGWLPATYDAHDSYFNLIATPKGGDQGKFNTGKYSNPQVDALLEKAKVELDAEKRQGYFDEVYKLVHEDAAVVPLHQQMSIWAKRKGINMVHRADDFVTFFWIKM